jgi:GNAT superfamily N-acetyltransferase
MTDATPTQSANEGAITFRRAQFIDLDLLLKFMQALQLDDPWSVPFNPVLVRNTLRQLLEDSTLGRVWIISDGAEAIGYIVMSFDFSLEYGGRNAWIDEIFVQRSRRGKKIGTQALEFFAEQARVLGVTAIHLEVNRGNPALELYRRMGYRDHERYLMTQLLAPKP